MLKTQGIANNLEGMYINLITFSILLHFKLENWVIYCPMFEKNQKLLL